MNIRILFSLLGLFVATVAQAVDVRFDRVAEGVYAHIGDLGPRTAANEGLNANLGLVVTPAQGAEVIAHAQAQADMRNRGNDHLDALRAALGAQVQGTVPTLPTRWLSGADERIEFGGVVIELRHRGGAHTPGDLLVWLPQQRVVFSGDVVYVDRLLGVIPVSRTGPWLATFAEIERLAPLQVVPGHGRVTDLATAQAATRDYLLALRTHMKQAIDDGLDISQAVKRFDGRPFMHLLNAAELMPGNASRTYLELERE